MLLGSARGTQYSHQLIGLDGTQAHQTSLKYRKEDLFALPGAYPGVGHGAQPRSDRRATTADGKGV